LGSNQRMDTQQYFCIAGTGAYLPQRCLTAEDIDGRIGRNPGWTRARTGVVERRECASPESLGSMARVAIQAAMHDANTAWADIDMIVDCSTSRHRPIPCNAAHLQALFGEPASGIPCIDVQSTCLGFIVALHVANGLMHAPHYRAILVVCSEAGLAGVNWSEPESAALVGDGAAAAVLRRRECGERCAYFHETYSQYLDCCRVDGGGHLLTPYAYTADNDVRYRFHMDGRALFRAVRKHLPPMVRRAMQAAEASPERLHVVPHQASPGAAEFVSRLLKLPQERFHGGMERFGNLAAAGIPYVLHRCRKERVFGPGDQVMLMGTSAGYSQAVLVFRM
jgi:3-oxoacyl-[acyl-carrier-protein] synthase III